MRKLLLIPYQTYQMLRWLHTTWAMRFVCPASADYLELLHVERDSREAMERM